jgi:hypothetical protein
VLARAGLTGQRPRGAAARSPEDEEEAINLLTQVAAIHPTVDCADQWWWRSLRGHPRFQELLTLTAGHAHH